MRPRLLRTADIPPIEAALRRFYGNRPDGYASEASHVEEYKNYSRFVAEHAGPRDLPCIDLGCGSHKSPVTLSRAGFERVIGVDFFSESELERFSKAIDVQGVTVEAYDGSHLPFETGSVGTVASFCVLEHVPRVSEMLSEIDRVLAPGGSAIIVGPNWSGISNPVRAILRRRQGHERYWQYETLPDSAFGVFRSLWWYATLKLTRSPRFILVHPRCDPAGEIDFEEADDDAVHLCQPLSFKNWFVSRRYTVHAFNRDAGNSQFARVFNRWFPGLATTNQLAFEKPAAVTAEASS